MADAQTNKSKQYHRRFLFFYETKFNFLFSRIYISNDSEEWLISYCENLIYQQNLYSNEFSAFIQRSLLFEWKLRSSHHLNLCGLVEERPQRITLGSPQNMQRGVWQRHICRERQGFLREYQEFFSSWTMNIFPYHSLYIEFVNGQIPRPVGHINRL